MSTRLNRTNKERELVEKQLESGSFRSTFFVGIQYCQYSPYISLILSCLTFYLTNYASSPHQISNTAGMKLTKPSRPPPLTYGSPPTLLNGPKPTSLNKSQSKSFPIYYVTLARIPMEAVQVDINASLPSQMQSTMTRIAMTNSMFGHCTTIQIISVSILNYWQVSLRMLPETNLLHNQLYQV